MALTAEDFGFTQTFLNSQPEVARVVQQAIDGEWTPTRAIAAIKDTSWWRSKSDAQRRYDAMSAENPGEIQRQVEQAKRLIYSMAHSMGFPPDGSWVGPLAIQAVQNGLSREEIQILVAGRYKATPGYTGAGQKAEQDLRKMAADYGIKFGSRDFQSFAGQILTGNVTVDHYKAYMADIAARHYVAIADDIKRGFTVREIAEPYIQIAASELGINPSDVDIYDPKWNRAFQYRGDKSTEPPRMMTQDEWLKTIRTDQQYGWDKTNGAQRQASILAAQLSQAFTGATG